MKLGLGTVQLGAAYGVANRAGKPDEALADSILKEAWRGGIDAFDTAASYGDSENRIGRFVLENELQGKIKISTKTGGFEAEGRDLEHEARAAVEASLQRLNVPVADYFLLHAPAEFYRHGKKLSDIFVGLKKEGRIRKFGVSVYSPADVRECLLYPAIGVLQVPVNLMDHRLTQDGLLSEVKRRGIEVHARSVFLQGLLTMEPDALPAHLQGARPQLERIKTISRENGLTEKELAMLYVRDNPDIDTMFIGCETLEQLRDNLRIMALPAIDYEKIRECAFFEADKNLVNPSLWKR